jgi:hypothetical protein
MTIIIYFLLKKKKKEKFRIEIIYSVNFLYWK